MEEGQTGKVAEQMGKWLMVINLQIWYATTYANLCFWTKTSHTNEKLTNVACDMWK